MFVCFVRHNSVFSHTHTHKKKVLLATGQRLYPVLLVCIFFSVVVGVVVVVCVFVFYRLWTHTRIHTRPLPPLLTNWCDARLPFLFSFFDDFWFRLLMSTCQWTCCWKSLAGFQVSHELVLFIFLFFSSLACIFPLLFFLILAVSGTQGVRHTRTGPTRSREQNTKWVSKGAPTAPRSLFFLVYVCVCVRVTGKDEREEQDHSKEKEISDLLKVYIYIYKEAGEYRND